MWEALKLIWKGREDYIRAYQGSELVWEKLPPYEELPFGIKAVDGSIDVRLSITKTSDSVCKDPELYYSLSYPFKWTLWEDVRQPLTVPQNKTLYLYGPLDNEFSSGDSTPTTKYQQHVEMKITGAGNAELSGQFMSIMNPDWTQPIFIPKIADRSRYSFAQLKSFFASQTKIINAENMHINAYGSRYYGTYSITFGYMFQKCTNLVKGPKWDTKMSQPPGIGLAICMFDECSSLEEVEIPPIIYSTNNRIFENFVRNCANLKKITYRGTTPVNNTGFATGVPSTGEFYNYGGASITRGSNGIPEGWTIINGSARNTMPMMLSLFDDIEEAQPVNLDVSTDSSTN